MENLCKHCGENFTLNPRSPGQTFCNKLECQRARKRQWQRNKLAQDSEYRESQADAQTKWRSQNPEYWREYRKKHPDIVEKNRLRQRERNLRRRNPSQVIAKMDAFSKSSNPFLAQLSGLFQLVPLTKDGEIAKMDVFTVQISSISGVSSKSTGIGS